MFSVPRIATVMALAAGLFVFAAPANAKNDCRHDAQGCRTVHRTARQRDWYLHRPSTPRERAETRALNHEELAATVTPEQFAAIHGNYAAIHGDYAASHGDFHAQLQYQQELREYRAAQQRYERDMRLYAAGPRDRRLSRDGRDYSAARQAKWPEELDNDPCAPTGGQADPDIAAPTNLDGAVTGLTQFNARASGVRHSCEPRRRR